LEKIKTNIKFKKAQKIILRTIFGLILLLLLLGVALSLPFVQTKIAHYLTQNINETYKTNIYIDEVAVTIFGGIKLKKVIIKDHHLDTLMYANNINTSILDFKKLSDGKLIFGNLYLNNFVLNLKNYKNEKHTNLDLFIEAFDDGKPGNGNFLMTSSNIYLTNSRFILIDDNREIPKDLDLKKLKAHLKKFEINGANVSMTIKKMTFLDHRGLFVKDLSSDFVYTKKNIKLNKLNLITEQSYFHGDVILNYDRKDFSDFNNKVIFEIDLDSASLATNDIRYFYNELGKDKNFFLKAKVKGTLNNFYASNLYLKDNKNSIIEGDINFRNLFPRNPGEFYMKGDFDKISSNYDNLIALLPNVLGKNLPSSLKKIGQFNFFGKTEITKKTIVADFFMNTALGIVESDLSISNINTIDKATYEGNIILDNFDIGTFLNRKDLGKVSLNLDVDGTGFTQKYLNTTFAGDVFKVSYNGYTYSKIIVDGSFKQPIFKGKLYINDPNLFMDFDGLVDLSKKDNQYDFHSKIDYANLKNLNFLKDSISVFKGDIVIKASGNSIDNMKGELLLTNASYQNQKDIYFIDFINVNSSFDSTKERTIAISSPDAINGSIVGKYKFNQLQKMVENSLGSLYTNYKKNKVEKGQYLKFNFEIYSKIIEIFYPDISLSANTLLKGNISSDKDDFKLDFNSPKITAFDNSLDNVFFQIDNKNPLYNTYLQVDSIKTKHYKVRDFSLINTSVNDTLYFRTEFKGGNRGQDFYNLNLYHTINKENQNVIGFHKSELQFKDFLWYLNEDEEDNNKIVFDKSLKNFSLNNFVLSHENQKMELMGFINGKSYKDLELSFHDVDLNKITPNVEKFKIEGKLNGEVNFKQENSIFQPTSSLTIDSLFINENSLGRLNLDIAGDNSLRKFFLKSTLENESFESFNANGNIEVVDNETLLDIDLNFNKFNLGVLSKIGGEVITNIRGFASGSARIDGNTKNLDYNGRLFVNDAGMKIPYLNLDFKFEDNSIIDVTENKFIVRETNITDTKYKTTATLEGFIKHKQFGDWQLDLNIDSKRFLALDTKDSEDAAYYGTAFINGNAEIKGPTSGLLIKVNAESAKGTDIKIPINDAESISDNNFIRFITEEEKYNKNKKTIQKTRNYNGLELEFNFEIKDNASIEVILDRESGHGMKGKGFGTLLFKINTLGKFNMWGDFQAYEGSYNFKYGNLIDKKFDVKKGGSINWSGDPMAAVLNLEAVYKTTANPALLIENLSFNKKVDVEVIIGVRGNLSNPEPDFNINFPTVSSVLQSEIKYKLDDKDVRETQALHLLAVGNFLSQDGVNQSQTSNIAYEKASSIFNDIFADKESKLNLGIDFVTADRTPDIESNGRFGITVSSKINERISINGKVGVPVGGINESAIVGDVEIQYRVNEDGSLNLTAFNRENDINYLGQGIGYTQGLGISYEVDFDTFSELINKIFNKAKLKKAPKVINQVDDSNSFPDNITFPQEKDKRNEAPKPSSEAIPVEEE
jgi:hypothetical protein